MATTDKLMTADELLRLPDDGQRHELIAGELRTMPLNGAEHGRVAANLATLLGQYVHAHHLGYAYAAGTGFQLTAGPDTVRAPDFAFVRQERVLAVGRVTGYLPGPPDLAAEVLSPNDRPAEVEEKVASWLAHGTRLVLVVDPRRRTVRVYRPGTPPRTLAEQDVLSGEDVVPGWTLPVGALFE
jgi:Uma2 family endonuclease